MNKSDEDKSILRLPRWVPFGKELAARRDALSRRYGRRVTQKEIADIVGITEKQLSRIETAISGTDFGTVSALANALEYTDQERSNLYALAGFYSPDLTTTHAVVREGTPPEECDDIEEMMTYYKKSAPEVKRAAKVLLKAALHGQGEGGK